MRYKRTYISLGSIAVLLVLVHLMRSGQKRTKKYESNSIESLEEFDGKDPDYFAVKQIFGIPKRSRYQEKTIPEKIEPKCEVSGRNAPSDINMYDLWNEMNQPIHSVELDEDNFWYNLDYNKTMVSLDQKLRVFVMPHCHADPGWLRTYQDYSQDTDNALNYMLKFLPNHPEMTFTWMEVSFFQLWWSKLNTQQKDITKKLISDGQLELTSGSWVMTDEANPYYWASINNIIDGHQWLQNELGFIPKVQWSNDPFGYGPSVPWLFHKAGLDRLVINRIHRSVKMQLERQKAIPFQWRQNWDTEGSEDIITNILPFQHYDVPNSCGPNPDVCCQFDFKRLTDYYCPGPAPVKITRDNVAEKAELLYDQYRKTASMSNLNVLLSLLGDDFRYIDEEEWHQQYDNYMPLFKYMNSRSDWNIEVSFGTFSDYFKLLEHRSVASDQKLPTLSGDFFPYHDFADHYWTGYFTTRPFYKRVDRILQGFIRGADILLSLAFTSSNGEKWGKEVHGNLLNKLDNARKQLSLFQHHDAITGTSRYAAVADYGTRMFSATLDAKDIIAFCTKMLMMNPELDPKGNDSKLFVNEVIPQYDVNEVKMPIIVSINFPQTIVIYNSLPYKREDVIKLHINTPQVTVSDSTGELIKAQINPVVEDITIRPDLFELVFLYPLPALSLTTFKLEYSANQPVSTSVAQVQAAIIPNKRVPKFSKIFKMSILNPKIPFKMETSTLTTMHEPYSGLVSAVLDKNGIWRSIGLEFYQYTDTRSGAYLFVPTQNPVPWPVNLHALYVFHGPILSETHVFFDKIYHKSTIYDTSGPLGKQIHIQNVVDLRGLNNVELVMRVNTDLNNTNSTFYTDSIGLQFLKRQNHPNQRVDRNYYPMPSAAFVQNLTSRVTILGGHPHGVTSPMPGTLEIMLDRILTQDDYKGLGSESDSLLNDNIITKSDFRVLLEDRVATKSVETDAQNFAYHSQDGHQSINSLLYPPIVMQSISKPNAMDKDLLNQYSPLGTNANFPCDVDLVTIRSLLESKTNDKLLILLRHGVDCSIPFKGASFCEIGSLALIPKLLEQLNVNSAEETNLSGVLIKGEISLKSFESFSVKPMDIKTFLLKQK